MQKAPLRELLISGRYKALDDPLNAGTLEARLGAKGVMFFWRVDVGAKTYRYRIGPWDSAAPPLKERPGPKGYSRAAAHQAAREMSKIHIGEQWGSVGGYPAYLAKQELDSSEAEELALQEANAQKAAELAQAERMSQTLERLIRLYVAHLERLGKQAAYDAGNILENHVIKARPTLASKPAAEIEPEEFADVLRGINEAGKGRTANKARSYMRAAYALAAKAKTDPSIPLDFKLFRVRHNPLVDVSVISGANRRDKNPIRGGAFVAYWRAIENLPGVPGHVLRLHLLTGAQRVAQFARLNRADYSDGALVFKDSKGKRTQPRIHVIPLLDKATVEWSALLGLCKDKAGNIISNDGGKTPIWPSTINDWAKKAAGEIEGFSIKRVRSGVETLLSSKGVSQEVRAQLQSHGLGSVQERHYDGHDYLEEKLNALKILHRSLIEP